ncbi:MAG: hypothetical protein HND27_02230 [Bacteroidetes bacterium]|nr:hypothetical protein [Bacteroidota bacterium]MBV6460934.1 hypothetical protein [Flavobacteriales bacterium]WKZ75669.1 MAG: hypothetical protein QY303_02000 [Vicingaceae bacterium]NOG94576.1 hypothetical protein [Bacteroidota bacterium]CAG0950551.1 hypothetical protein FLAV_00173 [Flavobacteriales bacterium]
MKKILFTATLFCSLSLMAQSNFNEQNILSSKEEISTELSKSLSEKTIADFQQLENGLPASVRFEIHESKFILLSNDVKKYIESNTTRYFITKQN